VSPSAREVAGGRDSFPEAKPLRLFIAADIPARVKADVASAVGPYTERIPAARWTRSDGWHITLKFLGATWPRLMEEVRGAVRTVAGRTQAFETRLTEMGVFPSPGRTRVVWVGLEDAEGHFPALVKSLDDLLAENFGFEKRAFTPHLTLARLNPPRNIREFIPDLVGTSVASEPFMVDRLVLYQSHLSPKGATYESLLEAPFGSKLTANETC
jgi:RNA 2',3'-cyclic 3'-phosphodiesterase